MSEEEIGAESYKLIPITIEKGDEVQKLSVVQSLPQLVSFDSNSALTKVLPKIQQELNHSSSEFQISTSNVFQILISSRLATEGTITATLLQGLDSRDPVVANAWLDTLLEVILILPLKTVQSEVVPLAIHKGQCSQPMTSRIASCRILGKISTHPNIKSIEIKKDLLPLVYGLCQDINYNVRAVICEQIPAIVQGLGCNLSKNHILPNLVELSQDDNPNVRSIAVSSVVNCLPHLDRDTKTNTMCPLVMQLCQSSMKTDCSSLILAKHMGLLMSTMDGCISQPNIDQLIYYYLDLANRGFDIKNFHYHNVDTSQDVLCRQYCASNLPAVALFIVNNAQPKVEQMYEIFKSLASDSCYMVRQTVAAVLHEVARILGKQNTLLKPDFVRLLRDDAEEVLQMLVPHLSKTFELFVHSGILSVDHVAPLAYDIGKAMLKCLSQLRKSFNWRLLTIFLMELEYLPKCFRCEHIHNEFTPAIIECAIKGGPKPVRSQAVRTLLVFLRWNTRQVQRTWLREHLIAELADSKCSYTRHIFIIMAIHSIEIFSNKYFKEYFFYPVLNLSDDRVSTVRYCVVNLLPTLRRMIRLPNDRRILQTLEHVILKLEKNEKDIDVLANLIKRSKEMMTPILQADQDIYELNEKKLIEEEENVQKGKLAFQLVKLDKTVKRDSITKERTRSVSKSSSRSHSVTKHSKTSLTNVSPFGRSTSVPRSKQTYRHTSPTAVGTSTREIISDMTFLKQHFYIDAGIHLPMEEMGTSQIENIASVSKINITDDNPQSMDISVESTDNFDTEYTVENAMTSLNITDDVKVNLRNMSKKTVDKSKRYSHSEIPTAIGFDSLRNKRHSSVHTSDHCLKQNSPINKRRSLNIPQKEVSKIPILISGENEEAIENKSNDKIEDNKPVTLKRLSNLPIPVRRRIN